MDSINPDDATIRQILQDARTIAVVGLSPDTDRTSHQIAKIMQAKGYRIIPVHPKADEVLGEKAYGSLADIAEPFDIINVFRRPEYLPSVARDAQETSCRVFWAQLGIFHEEAYDYLQEHDFTVIMDACIKVEHEDLIHG